VLIECETLTRELNAKIEYSQSRLADWAAEPSLFGGSVIRRLDAGF
jgi:hypothetical protein